MSTPAIYCQDNGFAGMLIVVAWSEEEARELMKDAYTYDENRKVTEHKFQPGLTIFNYGDH